jgi:opacity protein-like surface antigen
MFSTYRAASLIPFAAVAIGLTAPAHAQDQTSTDGPYAVARAGVAIDSDLAPRENPPAVLNDDIDFGSGFAGEIGGGYKFSNFRIEGTVGYSSVKIDDERSGGGFADNGRLRSLNLGLSAYADIPLDEMIVPYIGGGIGASRVDGRLTRGLGTPATVASFDDKDWGFQWHLDAGVGIKATDRTTIELGARYTRTNSLSFDGRLNAGPATYEPRLSSVSGMIGIRQAF